MSVLGHIMSIRGIVTIFLIGIIFCDAAAAFLLHRKSGISSHFLLDFVKNLFIYRKKLYKYKYKNSKYLLHNRIVHAIMQEVDKKISIL